MEGLNDKHCVLKEILRIFVVFDYLLIANYFMLV